MAKAGRKAKRQTRAGGTSFARLTPYLRGIIYGLMLAGYSVGDIVDEVAKRDGSQPSPTAVRQSLEVSQEIGGMAWDGVVETGAGRPKKTTHALDRDIVRLVFKHRGTRGSTSTVRSTSWRCARRRRSGHGT